MADHDGHYSTCRGCGRMLQYGQSYCGGGRCLERKLVLHQPPRARGHRAMITDGHNGLGLREREEEPIRLPSPSPGAYTP